MLNKLLLAGDKFMPGMHLRQLGFSYSACGPFDKNKERRKYSNKQEVQDILIKQSVLDKTCFQYYMAYGDFKDLNIRTATCKVFSNKVFNIAENEKNI